VEMFYRPVTNKSNEGAEKAKTGEMGQTVCNERMHEAVRQVGLKAREIERPKQSLPFREVKEGNFEYKRAKLPRREQWAKEKRKVASMSPSKGY